MLAGRMKLKHFLALVGIGGVAAVGGGGYVASAWMAEAEAERAAAFAAEEEAARRAAAEATVTPASAGTPGAVTALHQQILGRLGSDLGAPKVQDAFGGPVKVNLYQDAGHPVAHRAKVDLDRDDHDDEKWTWSDGLVERQVSPGDDGQYTQRFRLEGDRWVDAGAAGPDVAGAPGSTTAMPASATDVPLARDVDRAVVSWRGKALGSDKIKDATTGQPFKVNVYQDAGQPTANRAKVDLDRDDKWDEKWTFEPDGRVIRDVAPADDEQYTQREVWTGGRWVARP